MEMDTQLHAKLFGRINYASGKYLWALIKGTMGRLFFPETQRYGPSFPKLSAGWRISEED
jgi:hypothetical protein